MTNYFSVDAYIFIRYMMHELMRRRIVTVFVIVISVSLLSAPVAAEVNITGSATDITFNPSNQETAEIEFQVTNTGNETGEEIIVTVNESSLPSNLTLTNVDGTDPNPPGQFPSVLVDGDEVSFSDVDPSETVTVSATINKTTDTNATINGSLTATVDQGDTQVETITANITAPDEEEDARTGEELAREFAGDDEELGVLDVFEVISAFQNGEIEDSLEVFRVIEIFNEGGLDSLST